MNITPGFGKKLLSRSAVLTAGAALAVGGFAASAHADSANISAWTVSSSSCPTYFKICLFYSPGGTGGRFGTKYSEQKDLNGFVFGGSGAGVGDRVYNDAASADNNTGCNVAIWSDTYYYGDSDWLSPHKGGNLGPALRNHNQSVAVDDKRSGCSTP
ncbi:peptidase inhibitor family I36 protein [Streptomyces sp. NPDC046985]|uniref:peptidase inhibitor family I36 protein n=1 Tax=Streptomyces sp. NPDC046985 TaxID=3155377 RepID=UPI0033F35039